jgi:hypothetical protein
MLDALLPYHYGSFRIVGNNVQGIASSLININQNSVLHSATFLAHCIFRKLFLTTTCDNEVKTAGLLAFYLKLAGPIPLQRHEDEVGQYVKVFSVWIMIGSNYLLLYCIKLLNKLKTNVTGKWQK